MDFRTELIRNGNEIDKNTGALSIQYTKSGVCILHWT